MRTRPRCLPHDKPDRSVESVWRGCGPNLTWWGVGPGVEVSRALHHGQLFPRCQAGSTPSKIQGRYRSPSTLVNSPQVQSLGGPQPSQTRFKHSGRVIVKVNILGLVSCFRSSVFFLSCSTCIISYVAYACNLVPNYWTHPLP